MALTFDAASFPSLQGYEEVLWAPIFISPILGSPERFVVAIAVVGNNGSHISVASGLEKLRCLYGESSRLIVPATHGAIRDLDIDLRKRGREALTAPSSGTGLLSIGETRRVSAKDLAEVAMSWLATISSLHDSFSLTIEKPKEISTYRPRGDQLSASVWKFAVEKRSPVMKFFSPSLRKGRLKRVSLSDANLDFRGLRVVANFSTIRPHAHSIQGEFDRMLRRLWELDVSQLRAGHKDNDAISYELIIEYLNLKDFPTNPDRIRTAVEDLEGQADEKHLLIRQFNGADEIVSHLGSGLIDHIQKMTIAAITMADMKAWAQRS